MEITEAFRRIVVGHRWLIGLLAVGSLVVAASLALMTNQGYVASARIQQSSTMVSTDTEANSVVNQVRGIATSPAVVGQAMRVAGVHGLSPMAVGKDDVKVTEIGSSTVVDISVTSLVPRTAQDLSNAVARIVVDSLGGQQDVRKRQLSQQLRTEQQRLYNQRQTVLTRLSRSSTPDRVASLSARLTTVDQQLGDIASTLRQLAVPDSTDGSAMFISPAQEALPVHRNLLLDAILALLAGLVAGLLVASLIEVFRPKVADARTLARDLGVPFLGKATLSGETDAEGYGPMAGTDGDDEPDAVSSLADRAVEHARMAPETLVALRGAAAQTFASEIVLVSCGQPAAAEAAMSAIGRSLRSALGVRATQNGQRQSDRFSWEHPSWDLTLETLGREASGQRIEAVTLLSALAAHETPRHHGRAVLVVAALPAPQGEVDRVSDLSAATGWPVLGVLEVDREHGTRTRTPHGEPAGAGPAQRRGSATRRTVDAHDVVSRPGDRA